LYICLFFFIGIKNGLEDSFPHNFITYASFIKRYNSSFLDPSVQRSKQTKRKLVPSPSKNPILQLFPLSVQKARHHIEYHKCMFCVKVLGSHQALDKHQEKCQVRALKLRKKVMLQKVRSIILRSRRPKKTKKTAQQPPPKKILPFECTKCSDRFVSLQTLEIHMKYDHRPRPTCSTCQKMFDCRRKLLEHENLCNAEDNLFTRQSLGVVDVLCSNKVHTCNKCDNFFTCADTLREHKHMVNKRNPIPIEITKDNEAKKEKVFFKVCVKNAPEVNLNHVKFEKGEGDACKHCGKEFQNEKRSLQHEAFCHIKHGIRRTRRAAKPNGQVIPSKHETTCTLCNVDFKTSKKLTKHNLFFHNRNSKNTTSKTAKQIKCVTCKKTFLTQLQYQKHLKLHGSPNVCPLCTRFKHFETTDFLRWHITLVHKRRFCTLCRKVYRMDTTHKCRKLHLKRVKPTKKNKSKKIMIVEKDTPPDPNMETVGIPWGVCTTPYRDGRFPCHLCKEVFPREVYLMEHFITHTKLAPFRCGHCQKTFSDLNEYTSHVRSAHDNQSQRKSSFTLFTLKRFLITELELKYCAWCSGLFMGAKQLAKHHKRVHTENLRGDVVFSFTARKRERTTFVSVDESIPITDKEMIDTHDDPFYSPIKSSGPPLERIQVATLEERTAALVNVEKDDDPLNKENGNSGGEYLSMEEAAESLLLPLSLSFGGNEDTGADGGCSEDEDNDGVSSISIDLLSKSYQQTHAKDSNDCHYLESRESTYFDRDAIEVTNIETEGKKRRGRPPVKRKKRKRFFMLKQPTEEERFSTGYADSSINTTTREDVATGGGGPNSKKRRGRPRKNRTPDVLLAPFIQLDRIRGDSISPHSDVIMISDDNVSDVNASGGVDKQVEIQTSKRYNVSPEDKTTMKKKNKKLGRPRKKRFFMPTTATTSPTAAILNKNSERNNNSEHDVAVVTKTSELKPETVSHFFDPNREVVLQDNHVDNHVDNRHSPSTTIRYPRCDTCDINFLDDRMLQTHNDIKHVETTANKSRLENSYLRRPSVNGAFATSPPPTASPPHSIPQFIDLSKNLFGSNLHDTRGVPHTRRYSGPERMLNGEKIKNKVRKNSFVCSGTVDKQNILNKLGIINNNNNSNKQHHHPVSGNGIGNSSRKRKQTNPKQLKNTNRMESNDESSSALPVRPDSDFGGNPENNNNINHVVAAPTALKESNRQSRTELYGYREQHPQIVMPPIYGGFHAFQDRFFGGSIPITPVPTNGMLFTAPPPKWDERSAFDVWNV